MDSPNTPTPEPSPPSETRLPDRESLALPDPRKKRRRRRRTSQRTHPALSATQSFSGALILFLTVFTPWAFGTTQSWSIWIANVTAYTLGATWLFQRFLHARLDLPCPRWTDPVSSGSKASDADHPPPPSSDLVTRILAILTLLFLGYVTISALNARADYNPATHDFTYFDRFVRWLPHSYDRGATLASLAQFVALAAVFWATRDWLLTRTDKEPETPSANPWEVRRAPLLLPRRLRLLLWVLCLNGALLALVGILQRADGTNSLLWILESRSQKSPEHVFGPWSYRANAAQYFNLLWPVCLAFWIWAQEQARRAAAHSHGRFDGPPLVLLPCALFLAACPMISTSRGGALVSIVSGTLALACILLLSRQDIAPNLRWLTGGVLVAAGLVAAFAGWNTIQERLAQPDARFPTRVEVHTNDFTYLARLQFPVSPDAKWRSLSALSGNARRAWSPASFHLNLAPNGTVVAQVFGSAMSNITRRASTQPLLAESTNSLVLAAIRQGPSLTLYANGRELPGRDSSSPFGPGWPTFIHSRQAFVHNPAVSEIALVNFALTPAELEAANHHPLQNLETHLLAPPTPTSPSSESSSLILPQGIQVTLQPHPLRPNDLWQSAHRVDAPGPVAIAKSLADLDRRLRGPVRVSFEVWNPTDQPLHLALSLDDGPLALVQVPARTESILSVPCRAPHGSTPQRVQIALVDDLGEILDDLPIGTSLLFRHVHLLPGGSVFSQSFNRELRLWNLSDRMSNRPEIYETGFAMARDYPWWGAGAGSFVALYQLYMKPGQEWAAYLHNDWLELRITLGLVGLSILVLSLVTLAVHSWIAPGIPAPAVVPALLWLALAGCLVHARFDFPFQVYSVAFLFTLLAAVVSSLSVRTR